MRLGYEALRALFLVATFFALASAMYALASAPSRVASRLGLRGLKRQRATAGEGGWAYLEPLVRWLGVRLSGVVSEDLHASLDRQLALAGDWLGLTPAEYVALSAVSSALGGLLGALFGFGAGAVGLMALVGVALGAAMPYLVVSSETRERARQINRGLPYAIDLMALAMSAGLDFPGAVRQVVEKSSDTDDALVEELTRVLTQLQLGRTRRQALLELADRAPLVSVGEFVAAVIQAEERGNPVADVLQVQAQASRQRRSVQAEEAAAKAGVAMVGPLFLLFGCIMLLVFAPMLMKIAHFAD
jgi:tight adherence protein C